MPSNPYESQQPSGLPPFAAPYKARYAQNLYLLGNPNGRKYWHLDYRFGSLRRKLSLALRFAMSDAGALTIATLASGVRLSPTQTQALLEFLASHVGEPPWR